MGKGGRQEWAEEEEEEDKEDGNVEEQEEHEEEKEDTHNYQEDAPDADREEGVGRKGDGTWEEKGGWRERGRRYTTSPVCANLHIGVALHLTCVGFRNWPQDCPAVTESPGALSTSRCHRRAEESGASTGEANLLGDIVDLDDPAVGAVLPRAAAARQLLPGLWRGVFQSPPRA